MASNRFSIRRTSTSGKKPTTSDINTGELGLNLTDGILYSTNGSNVFEIGANNTNVNVTGNAAIKSIIANGALGTGSQLLTSNSSGGLYWSSPGEASVNADAQYTWTNTQTFTNTITFNSISANGSVGSANQVLTSNGSTVYWANVQSAGYYDYGLITEPPILTLSQDFGSI